MNISNESFDKLIQLKEKFYDNLVDEVRQNMIQDGIIYVPLDTIEKDYEYFFKSDDNIIIEKTGSDIKIYDTFDKKDRTIQNDNMYHLIICKKKVKEAFIKEIERYNKNNEKIKNLVD